jgi:hypothetical protein
VHGSAAKQKRSLKRPLWFDLPAELITALFVTVTYHGGLLIFGSYRRTFDAYVHLFFADHYRRSWFSSFEPRWYTGFTMVSYPPGSHMLLALASKVVGLKNAFPFVALFAVTLAVAGMYRFARIWTTPRAAGYAALLFALSSSLSEALHTFGQLPTTLSMAFLLNSLPFADRWIRRGGGGTFLLAISASAATTAVHHVTTLFGSIFFLGPVIARALLEQFRTMLPDEVETHARAFSRGAAWPTVARRTRRVVPAIFRAGIYGVCMITGLVMVVLPYWMWSHSDPIVQVSIPHASRDNFLENTNAGLMFFIIPWGTLMLIGTKAVRRGALSKNWPLAASVGLAAFLGTGGTTPFPRMLLGGAFDVLTLDRFTLWSTFLILPLAGALIDEYMTIIRDRRTSALSARIRMAGLTTFGVATVALAVFSANLGSYRPMQPAAIDPTPIVSFMEKDQHYRWRYMTLGFGDQMAWLAAQMTAESVDGNYHSARRLPEMTTTPVERLEGAKYTGVAGLGSLQQFIANPEKYHLKFIFSNDRFYDPLLDASGWERLEPLRNGVAVWQREDIQPLPAGRLREELPRWQRIMWGTLPVSAMGTAVTLFTLYALGIRRPKWLRLRSTFVGRIWNRLDHLLYVTQLKVPDDGEPKRMALKERISEALARFERVFRIARLGKAVAFVLIVVMVAGSALGKVVEPLTPAETVYTYYDRLDLRNLRGAFDLLDEETRPSFLQYTTERSVTNGLVASYARLARISNPRTKVSRERAEFTGVLEYITPLSKFSVPVRHDLRRQRGEWRLVPIDIDISIPPEQLVVRSGLGYLSQGRRQVSSLDTAFSDILDRPEVEVKSARLVRVDGELSVVGEARNVDVDPAKITVTARLLDADGGEITSYTNAASSMHTALPGETVPFRVDFEGVAGLNDQREVEFEPGMRVPLPVIPSDIAAAEITVKAVVTASGIERTLVAESVNVTGDVLSMRLRNDGLQEATVPHVFLTLRRADGTVGWVQDAFLPEGVRPQRTIAHSMSVFPASSVEDVKVPTQIFTNALSDSLSDTQRGRKPLLGDTAGWASIDLTAVGFTRTPG